MAWTVECADGRRSAPIVLERADAEHTRELLDRAGTPCAPHRVVDATWRPPSSPPAFYRRPRQYQAP